MNAEKRKSEKKKKVSLLSATQYRDLLSTTQEWCVHRNKVFHNGEITSSHPADHDSLGAEWHKTICAHEEVWVDPSIQKDFSL